MDVPAEREEMSAQSSKRISGGEHSDVIASSVSPETISTPPNIAKPLAEDAVRPAGTSASQPPPLAQGTLTILGVCVVDFVCV